MRDVKNLEAPLITTEMENYEIREPTLDELPEEIKEEIPKAISK